MKTNVLLILIGIGLLAPSCVSNKKLSKRRKSYMEHTYTSIKQALNDAEVQLLSDTVKVIFNNTVMFEFNKAEVDKAAFPSFERFAKVLNEKSKTRMIIAGHTDSVGIDPNNMMLSTRRADSAKNVLVYYKVAPSRIYTWGFGAKEPIAPNNTDEGRAKNRRVEIIVLYDYK